MTPLTKPMSELDCPPRLPNHLPVYCTEQLDIEKFVRTLSIPNHDHQDYHCSTLALYSIINFVLHIRCTNFGMNRIFFPINNLPFQRFQMKLIATQCSNFNALTFPANKYVSNVAIFSFSYVITT